MQKASTLIAALLLASSVAPPAAALDRPWISDVFFYWYTWDYDKELGGWMGGVHNTPLDGYYDSRTLRDNRRSLWQASEWGLTHHFMDYWSPDWKGEGGEMREATVMRAAESLRNEGYDIWMAYYQDGQNFEMREFSKNVSEKRDVHQWLRDFARSPVWPKIDGQPLQLVYARNGAPKTTLDQPGFRAFLKQRYGDVAALNKAWNTSYGDFDQIQMSFGGRGHQRATSIAYQFQIWQREWQKLNGLVQDEFKLPGMRASFDVGYAPFMDFGYGEFARVLGGPHSYAGIFGPPHDQDVHRYIQASVARKYNTVFFDHFKNYYFDWDIRVPGTAFLPDPFHFDRFWVGALARRSEALLHLSWNEWWEGSNLEPCREFGKTYCEKNLMYATLMKLAFDSIRNAEREAPVAVLLNEWRLASGAPMQEELDGTIQTLRRLCVPFDLLPDGLVTADSLGRFKLVIAPACGSGLGYNVRGERIADVLRKWLEGGPRRLVVSHHPSLMEPFGIRPSGPTPEAAAKPGPDLNVFIDVGAEGDEQFLRSGFSQQEPSGGPVSPSEPRSTFRWIPGSGNETSLLLPASPGRDHLLRLVGRSIWPNKLSVVVGGREAASAAMPAGDVRLEIAVPAAAIGAVPVVAMDLRFAAVNVPGEKAPAQYPGEARVCNLMLESLQWSTANVAADTRKQQYTLAEDVIRLEGEAFGRARGTSVSAAVQPRATFDTSSAKVLSRVERGNVPRDVLVGVGPSAVLYVNGPLTEVAAEEYWTGLVRRWAGVALERYASAEHTMVNRLSAGDTEFVVAFNEDIAQARHLRLAVPAGRLSEAMALTRDGAMFQPLATETMAAAHVAHDSMRYYGVYQFAFAPVKVETPPLAIQPGERKTFAVRVRNLTPQPVRGQIEPAAVIPTITGKATPVELQPGEEKSVDLEITAARTADWGRKTIYLNLAFNDRRAVVLRELVVEKPAEVLVENPIVGAGRAQVALRVPENPYGATAAVAGAKLVVRGQATPLATIAEGGRTEVRLPPLDAPPPGKPELQAEKLRIELAGPRSGEVIEREMFVARAPEQPKAPPGAVATAYVFNPRSTPLKGEAVQAQLPSAIGPVSVRDEAGAEVPCQATAGSAVVFAADVPPRSARTYHVVPGPCKAASDLRCTPEGLGTGKGTLRVENAKLSAVFSEAAGGTITSLKSTKTGRDYGRKSLGINYGTFSKHDPAKPSTNTVEYIHEKKVRQEDTPGKVELTQSGPELAIVSVSWRDAKVAVQQRYCFQAGQPFLRIEQAARPVDLAGEQELVALNAQFQAHKLTKTYPNFVGAPDDKPQPHFGWRLGPWVPDYASLMAPDHFDESISLVIPRQTGLVGVRQGFWPAERPKAGKCELAQIELLGDRSKGCDATVYVLLHEGHQIVAKQFLADQALAPEVIVVPSPK